MQHDTCDDILDIDISVQIKAFDQALTEHLEDINFIIDDFNGFGIKDEGIDMTQWNTWEQAYGNKKTTPTETECEKMTKEPCLDVDDIGSFDKYIGVMVKLDD